jgi:MATE family multidrug resistance protein
MTYKEHIKRTFILAYPVIIGQLGFIMMGVVDSIMVGEIGATPLAAASLANSIVILIMVIGFGVSNAVTPLVAISVGANKFEECGTIFRQSLLINMVLGIILTSIIVFLSELFMYFNQPPAVVEEAVSYTKLIGLSVIPLMFFQTYKQFIEGFSIMKPAMILALVANLVNAFSNWIFIYGNLGVPALGLDGAGIATLISRLFLGFTLFYYVKRLKKFELFDLSFHFRDRNRFWIKKILRLGLPGGFQYFFEAGAFSFAVIMIGWLGTYQLAAHQIAINLASISFMAVLGISAAGGIRVGNAVGRGETSEVRKAGFTALLLGACIMGNAGIIFIILRNFLPTLYINEAPVIEITSSLLIIAALFQLSDGVQGVGIGILRGLTDVKWPTIITFFSYWILALPVGYLLAFEFGLGVQGVWFGFLIGLTSSATMLTLRFNKKSKQRIIV